MRFHANRLRAFTEAALEANVMYYAVRRQLYDLFVVAIDREGEIDVDSSTVITVRTFLSNRDNKPSSDARLAYEVAIMSIHELVG